MGIIKPDVREQYLINYPEEEEILKPFLQCFSVTWARRRRANNTELSVFFLSPEPFMSDTFGFDQEIMLVYSSYSAIEPRSIQAAESFMSDYPAKGRIEKLTYYFVSEAEDTEKWFHEYTSVNQESRMIIPISSSDISENYADPWFIRNKTGKYLYGRDLFDYRLPLERDTYFFGRSDLATNLYDAIKRSENRGIFGLRKTGKTSLLFKLERMLISDNVAEVLYYDCKLPSIRKLRWNELLNCVCEELAKKYYLKPPISCDEIQIVNEFMRIVKSIKRPALIVFDEIEYISPIAIEDKHWHKDFLDFWQTFWATQSRYRNISAMIAGVNPSVVEMDTVGGIQNPLFGIVSYQYLKGLNFEETRNMIRVLGKRMGIKFDHEGDKYIYERYGGHPLLTRMACSTINNTVKANGENRPVIFSRTRLESEEQLRDAELMFYCRHVVSELKQFYPEEYEMLEMLSSGQIHDYVELASYPEYTKHLESYGLISQDTYRRPVIAIPVIGRYVGLDLARREGRKTLYKVIAKKDRKVWIEKRKQSILGDLKTLENAIEQNKKVSLFGPNSFSEAEKFILINIVDCEGEFRNFINICNKCFVESIEKYGKSIKAENYYWIEIKNNYPSLWQGLQRIKIYRHDSDHLYLNGKTSEEFKILIQQDLEGKKFSEVEDRYFVLQQCVIDGLLTGIHIEISNVT